MCSLVGRLREDWGDEIAAHLPFYEQGVDVRVLAATFPPKYQLRDVRPLEDVERDHILAVVRANQGNRAAATKQLEIGIATLYRKLKQ